MSRGLVERDITLLIAGGADVAKAAIFDAETVGFHVKFTVCGIDKILMNTRRRSHARSFKTIDAAVKCCRQVGFLSGAVEVFA